MEGKKSTALSWLKFVFWFVVMIVLIVYVRQFFWLALPGLFTAFAKGMDLIGDH